MTDMKDKTKKSNPFVSPCITPIHKEDKIQDEKLLVWPSIHLAKIENKAYD